MPKILLVGNDPAERDVRALVIEFGGHRCKTAASLKEAMKLLRGESFDLAVTHFKPNGSSPAQIVKSLKSAFPEVPLMVLSESGDTVVKGADEVLVIPCSPENLLQRIERMLSQLAIPARKRPARVAPTRVTMVALAAKAR